MTTCPDLDSLARLLVEDQLDRDLQSMAEHVEQCCECQRQLERLSDDQELGSWRRSSTRAAQIESDAELSRALEQARALPTIEARNEETLSDLDVDLASHLAPPLVTGDFGSLGKYRLQRELGRGGMGIVFQAIDADLVRPVAIKLLRPDRNDATSRARFVREAQAAARIDHAHVVTVHAVVNPRNALPYIVMEFLAGGTLEDWILQVRRLPPQIAALIAAQIADGLSAAHKAGLVHRDVKPSNVLLTAPGLITVGRALLPVAQPALPLAEPKTGKSARPTINSTSVKITDFGLARMTELPPGSTLTVEGVVAGTPAYMSPEQISGPNKLDQRCDIYGLGVVVYEMLTGEVPFRGTPHTVLRQIEVDDPLPPRRLNDEVPVDLETICLKAMAKEPDRRYQSAEALAEDLRRWIRGEPIQARPVGPVERLRSWARRNPRVAGMAGTIFGLMLLLAVGSTVAAVWIAGEQRLTERQRLEAVRARDDSRRSAEDARLARDEEAKQAATAREAESAARRSAEAAQAAENKAKSLATAAGEGRSIAMDSLGTLVGKVYDRLGDTSGTIKLREELVQAAIDGLNRVSQNAERDASLDRNVMLTHQRLGLIYIDAGRTAESISQFERSKELVQHLLASDPGSALLERDLARAYGKLGDIAYHNLDDDVALSNYRQALEIYQAHIVKDPKSVPARDGLSITHNNLARLFERQDKLSEARDHAEKSLALAEELAATESDTRFARGLVVTLSRVGRVCERQFDFEAAERHYRRQFDLAGQLVAREPTNSTWLGDLSITLQNLSKLLERKWAFHEAADLSRRSLALSEAQAKQDPENAVAHRNLAIGHNSLADILMHFDDVAAREAFARALEIVDEQARSDPTSVQKSSDAIDNCAKLAALEARLGRFKEAAAWIRRGDEQLARLTAAVGEVKTPSLLEWQATSRDGLTALETADRAIHTPDAWRELPSAVQSRLTRLQAVELSRMGRHAEAAQAAEKLLKNQPQSLDDLATAATVFSSLVQTIERRGAIESADTVESKNARQTLLDAYARAAIEAARQYFQANPTAMQLEYKIVEFDPLRRLPAYKSMLIELRRAANSEKRN